jgi:carbamoylphosphate synthase large subunit
MKIHNTSFMGETADRFRSVLENEGNIRDDIIVNLGDWELKTEDLNSYIIINKPEAMQKARDKKQMFRIFQANRLPSLDFYDLKNFDDFARFCSHLKKQEMVLRIGRTVNVIKEMNETDVEEYEYATAKIEKEKELRVLMFRNKLIRAYEKKGSGFVLRNDTSDYVPTAIDDKCLTICKAFGLDIAGIDIAVEKGSGQYRLIEVNSSAGMGCEAIRVLINYLRMV